MVKLQDHYDAILEACQGCAEVGDLDDPISSELCYLADGISVDINFLAWGESIEDGDGYYTPLETFLKNVHVTVEEINGTYIINNDGLDEEIPSVELNELARIIEQELPKLLED